jgi:hypothetical protein
VKRFPNDARSDDFAQAAANLPWGEAAEAWRRANGAIGSGVPSDSTDAAKKMDAVAGYLTAYPGTPLKAGLEAYSDYLKHFSAAVPDKSGGGTGTWQSALDDFFANPLLSQLQYMDRSDGRRFYVMGDIKRQNVTIHDQVTVIFQAIDAKDASKRVPVLVDPPLKLVTEQPVAAPHTKVVAALAQEIKRIDPTNWDTWGVEAAERLRTAEDLDIVVRAVLLQRILKAEQQVAGAELGDVYGATLAALAKAKPDDVPWLDPAAVPESTRKDLAAIFAAMPTGEAVKAQLAQKRAEIVRIPVFDLAGVGMALREGEWTVASKTALPTKAVAYTVLPAEGARVASRSAVSTTGPAAVPGAFVQIGTVDKGQASLDAGALARVPQGSIVYLLNP